MTSYAHRIIFKNKVKTALYVVVISFIKLFKRSKKYGIHKRTHLYVLSQLQDYLIRQEWKILFEEYRKRGKRKKIDVDG